MSLGCVISKNTQIIHVSEKNLIPYNVIKYYKFASHFLIIVLLCREGFINDNALIILPGTVYCCFNKTPGISKIHNGLLYLFILMLPLYTLFQRTTPLQTSVTIAFQILLIELFSK